MCSIDGIVFKHQFRLELKAFKYIFLFVGYVKFWFITHGFAAYLSY